MLQLDLFFVNSCYSLLTLPRLWWPRCRPPWWRTPLRWPPRNTSTPARRPLRGISATRASSQPRHRGDTCLRKKKQKNKPNIQPCVEHSRPESQSRCQSWQNDGQRRAQRKIGRPQQLTAELLSSRGSQMTAADKHSGFYKAGGESSN